MISLLSSCSSVFYYPDHYLYSNPGQLKIDFKNIYFESEKNIQLHGWYLKNSHKLAKPKGLIVHFHGNAQNLSSHFHHMAWMTQHGYDLFIFDYRGYGISTDVSPSPAGTYKDALAALSKAIELKKQDGHEKLILVGHSLGGIILSRAVVDMKQSNEVDLLVLQSTFDSYSSIVKNKASSVWFLWPFQWLASLVIDDDYSPRHLLGKIKTKTLVMHGDQDKVIPEKFGKRIFEALKAPKSYQSLEGAAHNDLFTYDKGKYRELFLEWL